jgi:Transposase DDE domain
VTSKPVCARWAASCITWDFAAAWRALPLADANNAHDWRIYADFAQVLIRKARPLYASDPMDVDLDQSLYALDSTTIDLCLSLFPWAKFRSQKAAVKMHTLLDLRGNIPAFIRITEGRVHDVNILDEILPEAGAF